ncbi:MAG: hypothetical protein KC586_05105, partial [Myxococcales bacterium]|nr:hypothetical protein [Myxococcales bacterium]
MSTRLLPLALALSCFVVACGDDDAAPADASVDATRDGAAGAALVDAWCPMFAARQCEASITTCGCGDVPGFGDLTACRARVERACREQFGRFTGDPAFELASEIPAACFDALDEAFGACDVPPADLFTVRCPLVWPSALSRELPSEGPCVEGLCAEGTRCSSEGACAVPSAGGACGSVGDCPAEQRCGDEGSCRPLATEGAGASCTGPDACMGDLRCLAATRRECAPQDPGGSCVSDDTCASGEYCAEGTCTTAPGEGEACGNGVACATSLACAFMPGPDEGTCQPLPENGEACALGPMGPFVCAAGLACRDRFCGAIPGEGEDCAVGDVR